jgi:hypothetical protein
MYMPPHLGLCISPGAPLPALSLLLLLLLRRCLVQCTMHVIRIDSMLHSRQTGLSGSKTASSMPSGVLANPLAGSVKCDCKHAITLASAATLDRAASRSFSCCSSLACGRVSTLTVTHAPKQPCSQLHSLALLFLPHVYVAACRHITQHKAKWPALVMRCTLCCWKIVLTGWPMRSRDPPDCVAWAPPWLQRLPWHAPPAAAFLPAPSWPV